MVQEYLWYVVAVVEHRLVKEWSHSNVDNLFQFDLVVLMRKHIFIEYFLDVR